MDADEAAEIGNTALTEIHGERVELPLIGELWREYEWVCPATGTVRIYRINLPATVWFRKEGTTHTVVDQQGVAHCVPALGRYGCVLRWFNDLKQHPARF